MSNLQSRRETRLTQTITKAINGDKGALELLDVKDRARLNFVPSRAVTKESLTGAGVQAHVDVFSKLLSAALQ